MEELKAFARDKQDDLSILGVQTNITLLEALGADKINTKFETSWPNYHMVNEESKRDYDVFHGVTLYLLDRDKKILAKRFSLEQLDSILKNLREGR
jgi:hypothetical protein